MTSIDYTEMPQIAACFNRITVLSDPGALADAITAELRGVAGTIDGYLAAEHEHPLTEAQRTWFDHTLSMCAGALMTEADMGETVSHQRHEHEQHV